MFRNFVLSIALWVCHSFLLAQGNFTAICEAKQVLVGESFRITFQLTNAQGSQFQAPGFENFEIAGGPSRSMQTTIVNGKMSSSVGYVYEIIASKPGKFTIGAASIIVNGKKYFTRPVQIEVLKGSSAKSSSHDEVFILATLDKTKAYVGEQVVLQYKIYTQIDISGIEPTTQTKLEGFQVENVNLKDQISNEVYKGKSYTTKILNMIILFPITAKVVSIPPVTYKIALNNNDPFSSFSMGSGFSNQMKTIRCNEVTLQILDLPTPIPKEFSGAVGKFTLTTNSLQPRYTLNDAVALTYAVSGNGNFNTIEPKLQINNFFEISDYKGGDAVKTQDEPQLLKSRIFNYLLVPKQTGNFLFAPAFVYFDPEEKQYKQLIDTFHIQITEGTATLPTHSRDILPIKENVKLYYHAGSLWKNGWSWILLFCPIALLFIQKFRTPLHQWFVERRTNFSANEKRMEPISFESLENLLIITYQKHWQVSTTTSIREIKQILNSGDSTFHSQALLQCIQEYEMLRYSGTENKEKISELIRKIEKI